MMEYDEQALEAGTHDQHLRFEMAYFFYSHFSIPTFATFLFFEFFVQFLGWMVGVFDLFLAFTEYTCGDLPPRSTA